LGRLEEAETSYREAIKLNPNDADIHYNLGVTLSELGRLEEAETSYRETIKLNPKHAGAHANLGFLFFKNFMSGSSKDNSDEIEFYFGLAQELLVNRGMKKDAEYLGAFVLWMKGFKAWRMGNFEIAKKNMSQPLIHSRELDMRILPQY
jgi:tetratricopeptide (TPR) repeat protein